MPFVVAELGANTGPFILHPYVELPDKEHRLISRRESDAQKGRA